MKTLQSNANFFKPPLSEGVWGRLVGGGYMKQFLGFLRKEFLHIFRDPRTMMIIFLLPVVQLLLFGKVINTDIQNSKIAILDQSHDNTTREITSKLMSSGYFVLGEELMPGDDVEDVFRKGKVKMVVTFEPNFEQNLERDGKVDVQLLADASDPNTARILTSYASGIINDYVKKEKTSEPSATKSNQYRSAHALQRRIEECLHVCAWNYGHDFNADFSYDDFDINQ